MKESIFVILIILLAYSLSTSESYGNDEICYSDNLTTYNISHNGNIRVADDDQSIVSISPGGYLRFSAKTFGNQRRIEIESGSGGNLTCKYFEGNREIPFEPEGKKWLGEVLIHVIRASGIDADNRAVRIYKKSGLNGFFDEIMQISSNSVKDLYFSALLSNQKLPEEELAVVAQKIGTSISSNSERGSLFREFSELFTSDNEVSIAYLNAVSRMSSNSEGGSVLRNAHGHLGFNDPLVVTAYFDAVNSISSDTERSRVLVNLLKNHDLNDKAMVSLLNSTRRISSSSEKRSVLSSIPEINFNNAEIILAFFDALNSISSDSEKSRVLMELLEIDSLPGEAILYILDSTKKISSNTEKGRILRSAIEQIPEDNDELRNRFIETAKTISSDSEYRRVMDLFYCMRGVR